MKLKAKDALLFSSPALLLGAYALFATRTQARSVASDGISCGVECTSTIEPQPSNDAGELPALKRLAQQIRKCPNAKSFVTSYSVPRGMRDSGKPTHLYYIASDRMLWHMPSYTGDHRLWHRVTPEMITTLIDRSGGLHDLKSLGADQTIYGWWESRSKNSAP